MCFKCSFLPKFHISVETRYENNRGETENCHNLIQDELSVRTIDFIDIVGDQLSEHKYKETEDPKRVKSETTNRGPLENDWCKEHTPIMCAYKIVRTKFEVWGLQTRVESYTQRAIRDILLLAHRQAFAWTDEWYNLDYDRIIEYERDTYRKTNEKVIQNSNNNFLNGVFGGRKLDHNSNIEGLENASQC